MTRISILRAWRTALTAAVLLCALACNRHSQPPAPDKNQPADKPTATRPADTPTTKPGATTQPVPATKPAPATRPVEPEPVSTFDPRPPYPVKLYVRKPEDKQPGWLKIMKLTDEHAVAKAQGRFPEHNIIEIQTENVSTIRMELGYLPLAENKRVILRIDDQGIEITQRDRRFLTLERRSTGRWEVGKASNE